jgi:TolA-binding protein
MKNTALVAVLFFGFVAVRTCAQDTVAPKTRESILTYFRHLRDSLAQSAVSGQRKRSRVSSVAAVRGSNQASPLANPDVPVLKGDARSRKAKLARAEDAEFSKAVDLVLAGKRDEAIKALEAFKARHPKTHKAAEISQAIEQARALE